MFSGRQFLVMVFLALTLVPITRAADKKEKPAPEPFGRFTVDQVERRLGRTDVHLFDGNPPDVFAKNHVPGAVHLNTGDIKEGVLPADKSSTLIFYCMNEL